MMTSREYIKSNLQSFADNFLNVKLSYLYDESYSQHVIVVTPNEGYYDEKFAKQQIDFELKFIEEYPFESIYFVANGEIELNTPFELEVTPSIPETILISNSNNKALALSATFTIDLLRLYPNEILVGGTSLKAKTEGLIAADLFLYKNNIRFHSKELGESNYAMAA